MFKGMKTAFVCIILSFALMAPATYAQGWADTYSPLGSWTQVLKNLYEGVQNAVLGAWDAAFEKSESEAEDDTNLSDPTATFTSEPPPPPPADNDDDDDGGNFGGGQDPLG